MSLHALGIASDYMYLLVAGYFLFLLVFDFNRSKIHAGTIFISSVLMLYFIFASPHNIRVNPTEYSYIYMRDASWVISLLTALFMSCLFSIDCKTFAQTCIYTMLGAVNLITSFDIVFHGSFTHLFYQYFDQLIIMGCIAQMVVSYGNFKRTCCKIRSLLHRRYNFCGCCYENLFVANKAAP